MKAKAKHDYTCDFPIYGEKGRRFFKGMIYEIVRENKYEDMHGYTLDDGIKPYDGGGQCSLRDEIFFEHFELIEE